VGDDRRSGGKRGALRDRPRPAPRALELLDGALPSFAAEPRGERHGGEARDLVRNHSLVDAQDGPALGGRQGVEEGDAGQSVVAGSGGRRGLQEPATQLGPAAEIR
jgi:hypothetical protein